MSDSLITTKVHMPKVRENGVDRPLLVGKILDAVRRPASIVLVSGPAGFGKTTLLAEFGAACEHPMAWLSLDEADNDPITFWKYLIKACQMVDSRVGAAAAALFGLPQPPPGALIASVLINDLTELDSEIVLALDDLHVIHNAEIHMALSQLLEHQPAKFHLIASTRVDPPWQLPHMRAGNQLVEIRAADLRFSYEEASRFLERMLEIKLTSAEIEALEARTEGWVAGLQLAALSMRGRKDTSAFIKSFTGSHTYIAEYLIDEVFKNLPEETRKFLLETSILTQLSAGCCEAVTGCKDGRAVLKRLQDANAFVVSLDDAGVWYRYHQLFADLLSSRLHQVESKQTVAQLNERAAEWYEKAGMNNEAIDHYLKAGSYPEAIRIIASEALANMLQGNVRTVEAWLNAIPESVSFSDPRINLVYARLYLVQRSFQLASPYLERLERFFSSTLEIDSARMGQWYSVQAAALNLAGKFEDCIALGQQALELLAESDVIVRTLTRFDLATAHQQLAHFDQAADIFEQVAAEARRRGDFFSELVGISGRARMILEQGKLHLGFSVASEGIALIKATGKSNPFSASLYGETGQIYFHWHELDKAMEYLELSAITSGRSGFVDPEMYRWVMSSRIDQMAGDWQAAESEMAKVEDLMRRFPPAMIQECIVAQQVRVALAFGRLESARAVLEGEGFRLESPAWMGERLNQPGFTSPYAMMYNGALRYWMHNSRVSKSRVEMARLIEITSRAMQLELETGQLPNALEALLLKAQMIAAIEGPGKSLADVARALELAAPEGYVSVFVEEGLPIFQALTTLRQRKTEPRRQAYLKQIIDAFPKALSSSTSPVIQQATLSTHSTAASQESLPLIEKLSPREMEVLRLIANGDSNQKIADTLFITVSSVKKHTGNIFAKMNVNSRTQAIVRARELGLISP